MSMPAAVTGERPGGADGAGRAALHRWHRRCGILACAGLLLWSVSGCLHPLLSRYQPQPATRVPPSGVAPPAAAPAPGVLLAAHGIASVVRLRLVTLGGRACWQVETAPGAPLRYFDALDGTALADGDRRHAEALARHWLGAADTAVTDARRLTAFDGEYVWINRHLPVWRVAFARADGMRVYVDTGNDALATLIDDRKALYTAVFRTLHNWAWLGEIEWLRLILATTLVAAAFATGISGLLVHARAVRPPGRRVRTGLPRWHRNAGLVVALTVLMFAASGVCHLLWQSAQRPQAPLRAQGAVPVDDLGALPAGVAGDGTVTAVTLVTAAAGEAWYRLQRGVAATYVPLGAGTPAVDEAGHARRLALALSGLPAAAVREVVPVGAFAGEYGFVFKWLPVWRIGFEAPGSPRLYVHAGSGTLAARIRAADYAEGWTFAHLHKWQWLEFIGRWPRDLVMMSVALLQALVAGLGLALFVRGRAAGSG